MSTLILSGQKRSNLYFNKIDIYSDRLEGKALLLPRKTIQICDIISWIEINKKIRNTQVIWTELTIYTKKTSYTINSLRWHNYQEMKYILTKDKVRNTEKEEKIYKSFW